MKARLLPALVFPFAFSAAALAQIPNGGFENWTTPPGASYQDPDQWITFNAITSMIPGMGLSCEKVTPGTAGSSCVKVTTREAVGIGLMPGVIAIGDIMTGATGFPYTARPASCTGQWQYGIQPSDTGTVVVVFTKWNAGTQASEAIGGGALFITGTATGWQAMNMPLEYVSTANPDSAFVMVASSVGNGAVGSWVQLDALAFSGTATSISEQQPQVLQVYPSPATSYLTVVGARPMTGITILETTGRTVMNVAVNGPDTDIDVASLPQGRYFIRVNMADGTQAVSSFLKR